MNKTINIKAKIDETLNQAFKEILSELKISQQKFIEHQIKEFVISNIHLITKKSGGNISEKQ